MWWCYQHSCFDKTFSFNKGWICYLTKSFIKIGLYQPNFLYRNQPFYNWIVPFSSTIKESLLSSYYHLNRYFKWCPQRNEFISFGIFAHFGTKKFFRTQKCSRLVRTCQQTNLITAKWTEHIKLKSSSINFLCRFIFFRKIHAIVDNWLYNEATKT